MGCLAKDREVRIQNAQELASRLRALDPTETTLQSVAIDTSPRISLAHTADDRSTVEPSAQDLAQRPRTSAAASSRGATIAIAAAAVLALVVVGALVRRQVVAQPTPEPTATQGRAETTPVVSVGPVVATTASAAPDRAGEKPAALPPGNDPTSAPLPTAPAGDRPTRAAATTTSAPTAKGRPTTTSKTAAGPSPTTAPDFVDFGPRK